MRKTEVKEDRERKQEEEQPNQRSQKRNGKEKKKRWWMMETNDICTDNLKAVSPLPEAVLG